MISRQSTPAVVAEGADGQAEACTATSAKFEDCNFTGVNVAGASLEEATFGDSDLTGKNFTGANLSDADLTGATVPGANPEDAALLTDTTLIEVSGLTEEQRAACAAKGAILVEE